jgi:hypothetical protein
VHPTRLYDGWNTIGSLSTPISTERVTLLPYGSGAFPQIEGDIFRYVTDRGYQAVTEIQPGLGYWIHITGQAYLQMVAGNGSKAGVNFTSVREAVKSSSAVVTISDASNKSADLYVSETGTVDAKNVFELPPLPPNGMFDVRFSNQAYVEDAVSPLIRLQGVEFPATISMNNATRNYTVVNPVTGEVLGTVVAGRANSIKISDPRTPSIRLMGEEADLGVLGASVMPNPVATAAVVNITVPTAGRVTVELFNIVGERIATLLDDVKTAGVYGVDLNAASYGAGRYIVKVTNGNDVVTTSVTVVR